MGRDLTPIQARAAVRLATLNALASAEVALGGLARARRAVSLTCFIDAVADALSPTLVGEALRVLRAAFGAGPDPVVWLRHARGLAGGMPVEVELLLQLRE